MSAILVLHMSTSRSKPALDLRRVDGDPEVERWWDVCLKSLSKQVVGERSRVWHRRRVEQVLQRHPMVRSAVLRPADIAAFFLAIGG